MAQVVKEVSPVLPTLKLLVTLRPLATPATLEHQSDLLREGDREEREDQEICPAALEVLVDHFLKKESCLMKKTSRDRTGVVQHL